MVLAVGMAVTVAVVLGVGSGERVTADACCGAATAVRVGVEVEGMTVGGPSKDAGSNGGKLPKIGRINTPDSSKAAVAAAIHEKE